jgi:heterodisulfide reductase subunit B
VGIAKKVIQQQLSRKVLEQALAAGAEAVVTACPLCHQNLDLRQKQINAAAGTSFAVPVIYLSQIIGLALGFTMDEMMLEKHLIDPRPLVRRSIARAAQVKAEEAVKEKEKAEKARARAGRKPAAAEAPASTEAEE